MKRAARLVGVASALLGCYWLGRAVYIFRVWQIAHAWCPSVAAPSFGLCLSPNAWATTAHGVFADMALVRIPSLAGWVAQEKRDRQWAVAEGDGTRQALPLPSNTPPHCGTPDLMRLDPRRLPVRDWAACYGVAGAFHGVATAHDTMFLWTGESGGIEIPDAARKRLYIAAYRTR